MHRESQRPLSLRAEPAATGNESDPLDRSVVRGNFSAHLHAYKLNSASKCCNFVHPKLNQTWPKLNLAIQAAQSIFSGVLDSHQPGKLAGLSAVASTVTGRAQRLAATRLRTGSSRWRAGT